MSISLCLEAQSNVFLGKKQKVTKQKKCILARAFKHLSQKGWKTKTKQSGKIGKIN